MARIAEEAILYQIKRSLRPDWRRFWKPGHENDPLYKLYEKAERKYRPDQLRDDWGRFADEGRGTARSNPLRMAASDKPPIGRAGIAAIAAAVGKRVIEAFRSKNGLYDLFKSKVGTISHTNFEGKDVFGSNSTSPMYVSRDRLEADTLRDRLVTKEPDVFKSDNLGSMPNDALYHSETNVLTRAARENGGTLAGQKLIVYTDRPMCNNCEKILPRVGLELGNPEVTYVYETGKGDARIKIMRDGRWLEEGKP